MTSDDPFGAQRETPSKCTEEHKQQLICDFIARNNDQSEKLSLREYCRQTDKAGCNESNLSRWMRSADNLVRACPYPVVPTSISPATESMRLQYCEASAECDWTLCAFYDQLWVDTNETSALLHGQEFYFTTQDNKEAISPRPKSKVK